MLTDASSAMRPGEKIMLPSGTAFIEKKKICRYYDHHHLIITSVGALAEGNDVYVVKTANALFDLIMTSKT